MKKFLVILILSVASFTLSAQNRMSYSLEFVAGVGVEKGPLATFTPEFIAQYNLGGFTIGAGAGARYARPCFVYDTTHGRDFQNELDIPVFLRLGFGKSKFFANVDAGYAFGILGYDTEAEEWSTPRPIFERNYPYDGLFFEPHFGWRLGQQSALALGVLLQKSTVHNQDRGKEVINGKEETVFYISDTNEFTPTITLRYILAF